MSSWELSMENFLRFLIYTIIAFIILIAIFEGIVYISEIYGEVAGAVCFIGLEVSVIITAINCLLDEK